MKKIIAIIIGLILIISSTIVGYLVVSANTGVKIEDDIIEYQNEIQKDFKIYGYTIDNPNIILNPYEISPLTALIIFETEDETKVTLTIYGKNNDNITNTFEATTNHFIPVYGLYPDYENKISLTTENKTKEYIIKTDPIPEDFNKKEENNTEKIEFITTNTYPYAIDKNNEVRWYITKNYTGKIDTLPNNHLLLSTDKLTEDGKYTGLLEIDLLGKIHKEYQINTGYYGNYTIKDNSIIVESKKQLEIDRQTGSTIKQTEIKERNNIENNKNYIDFYNSENNYKFEVGYTFKTNEITETINKNILLLNYKKIDKKYKDYKIKLTGEKDRLVITGAFKKDDKVYIILDKFLDKKVYELDTSNTNTKIIDKEGLSGKYSIYIKINNDLYKTNKYISF